MGIVYEAFDERLRRAVAVKVLHGALFGAREALRRFEREAQTSSRLTHPHVVRMYDYGAIGTDGAYLVMELLRGSTWRDELHRTRTLTPPVLGNWLDQILDGLQAAHDVGLIHRDLKPENLMICPGANGAVTAKILDFGLAKELLADTDSKVTLASLTAPGTLMGTYAYMAPEQLSASAVDARSDLFAIGVITVESLRGERPFQGRSLTDLVRAVLHAPFHLDGDGEEVRTLDACLQKALAKTPSDRYPSAAAMRAELIPAIRQYPGRASS
jgi:serine/threonine-protein kinase